MILEAQTNAQLVDIYNTYSPKPIASWKGKKSVLIDRINALVDEAKDGILAEVEAKVEVEAEANVEAEAEAEAEAPKRRTIRLAAIELLCTVVSYENKFDTDEPVDADNPNARSVGYSYPQIIDLIKLEFPKAQTTAASLRWYSVKIRVEEPGYEGHRLPQRRPRAKFAG